MASAHDDSNDSLSNSPNQVPAARSETLEMTPMSRTMASMSIKEYAERSSVSPTLGHDSTLNETNLDEDAATTP